MTWIDATTVVREPKEHVGKKVMLYGWYWLIYEAAMFVPDQSTYDYLGDRLRTTSGEDRRPGVGVADFHRCIELPEAALQRAIDEYFAGYTLVGTQVRRGFLTCVVGIVAPPRAAGFNVALENVEMISFASGGPYPIRHFGTIFPGGNPEFVPGRDYWGPD